MQIKERAEGRKLKPGVVAHEANPAGGCRTAIRSSLGYIMSSKLVQATQ